MVDMQGQLGPEQQSLIPGIQDDITLDRIVTKLHWLTLPILAQVSRSWRRAIQSRRVHEIRVRTSSTQTLVPIMIEGPRKPRGCREATILLYDASRDKWHLLPPIPGVDAGIPRGCECVCVKGKLYTLGGLQYSSMESLSGKEVRVMDLAAGGRVWERCADMTFSRAYFPCNENNGKIYVFGGLATHGTRERLAEVEAFDPEQNAWRVVAPMKNTFHNVASIGKMLYLYTSSELENDDCHATEYDPQTDRWTKLNNFARGNYEEAFVEVDGRVHKIDLRSTYVRDESNSWVQCQSISWQLPQDEEMEFLLAVVVVGEELLALAKIVSSSQLVLFRSKWFGRESRPLIFEKTTGPHRFVYWQGSLSPLRL